MLPTSLARPVTRVRRRLLGHRRLLAGLLTAGAVAGGLRVVAPAAPETVAMTVAAHDLAAGQTLTAADVTTAHVPPASVPDGAATPATGATLAGPLRRGEPITDARLVGPSLTIAHPGLVALPVRLPDGAMAGLLDAGDRIDLYAVASAGGEVADAPGTAGGASRVAAGVLVLAVPPTKAAGNSVTTGLSGRLILIGLPDDAVARVTDASVRSFLTFAFVH
ncbi:SAF domain-containing protein [Nocardioides panacihumi]|uniref:SAF domain-containing protein n=1 Tax=Nocardioides panacihumi TaxID=400774 RepID=A0ABP5CAL9_9ACTN